MTNTVRSLDVPRLDTKAALQLAAEEAARVTGADGAAIAIGNSSAMCCCASAGDAPDVGVLVGADSGLSGACLRTSELVQCDDTASDPRVEPQAGAAMGLRSVLILPVVVDGRLQAILEVVSARPHAFGAQHRHALSRMAQGIATLLTESSAKKPPKSSTEEHPVGATSTEPSGKHVEAASPTPASSSVFDPSQDRKQQITVLASSVRKPAGSYHVPASLADLRSLSATTKAGIGLAFVLVLALGWYLVGVRHTSTPAGTDSAPATKSSTAPSATPEQRTEPAAALPEITVEQNSLSVSGPEGAPKVSGSAPQLTPGQLVRKVEPVYPASARARGISGSVVLTALVTKDGRVSNVQFVRGPEALASPAIDAVRQWVYEPYRLGSEPVAVETMIVIRFTPHQQP
jgi:TonB family protein